MRLQLTQNDIDNINKVRYRRKNIIGFLYSASHSSVGYTNIMEFRDQNSAVKIVFNIIRVEFIIVLLKWRVS